MSILTDNFGPFGPLLAVGGLGLILVLATLPTLLKKRIDPLDKLKQSISAPSEGKESLRSAAANANARKDKLEKYKAFL
ncbi:MAG: type II secretion system F family protein, partial [Maritimibacter sp.]|nr:type II secretion system F family protein [Maritimibacter sp.]